MIFVLYIAIMNYFDGIEWVGFNHVPECRGRLHKYFQDYYVLDYNHRGELRLQLDDDPVIPLKAPVAWFTFPGPLFRFEAAPHAAWDHRHISFRGPRVKAWIRSGLVDFKTRCPVIPVANPERFAMQMNEVIDYFASPVYGLARAVQMFEGLLLQLHEQRTLKPPLSAAETRVSELITRIHLKPETAWSFKQEAEQFGISYSHFRLIFHRLTGLPPHQYVNHRRMEKAARLLRENQLAIKEIASATGYDDIFHFAKLFKKRFRTPPGRFRARSILT